MRFSTILLAFALLWPVSIRADDFYFTARQSVQTSAEPASPSNRLTAAMDYTDAVVEVVAENGNSGTGTLLFKRGEYGLVGTAAHVATTRTATAIWSPRLGHRSTGVIVHRDTDNDIAFFFVRLPASRARLFPVLRPLCYHFVLKAGNKMELVGFSAQRGSSRFHRRRLELKGWVSKRKNGISSSTQLQLVSQSSAPGDSGGPIVAIVGGKPYLAGINWGYVGWTDNGHTQGAGYATIHRTLTKRGFLRRLFSGNVLQPKGCEGFGCPIGSGVDLSPDLKDKPDDVIEFPPIPDVPKTQPVSIEPIVQPVGDSSIRDLVLGIQRNTNSLEILTKNLEQITKMQSEASTDRRNIQLATQRNASANSSILKNLELLASRVGMFESTQREAILKQQQTTLLLQRITTALDQSGQFKVRIWVDEATNKVTKIEPR